MLQSEEQKHHLTPNIVEGNVGGLRSFDGHQAEQADLMLSLEATKDDSSLHTSDDDNRQCD